MARQSQLLLDMDGVFVDFVGGVMALHNKLNGTPILHPADVTWDFPKQIGFQSELDPKYLEPFSAEVWANLPWTAEGRRLVTGLESIYGQDNIYLLSSPGPYKGAADGKQAWLAQYLPHYQNRTFVTKAKPAMACVGLLLDDNDSNVEFFRKAGGRAILAPRPWNIRRGETNVNGRFDVESLLQEIAASEEVARHG